MVVSIASSKGMFDGTEVIPQLGIKEEISTISVQLFIMYYT